MCHLLAPLLKFLDTDKETERERHHNTTLTVCEASLIVVLLVVLGLEHGP